MKYTGLFLLLLCSPALFAEHARAWQAGKLLDSQANTYYQGSTSRSSSGLGYDGVVRTSTVTTPTYATVTSFSLEGETYSYQFNEIFPPFHRLMPLTVGTVVKYADEGRYVYILDEAGKEHKMFVTKRALR